MTNILTLVLLVVLLTIVPMIPGFVMSKFLSAGLASVGSDEGGAAIRHSRTAPSN